MGLHGLTVTRVRAAAGGHAQLTLRREVDVVDAIAFERGDLVDTVREGDRIDVAGRLASRRFGGFETLQLVVVDVAPAREGSRDSRRGRAPRTRRRAGGEQPMTRRSAGGRGGRPVRRTTGDPYGLGAARPFLAPLLSFAGLAAVGLLTLGLLTGSLPFLPSGGQGPDGGVDGGPVVPGRTPSPSAAPVVNPGIEIDGKLVYAKAGNLWIQEGTETRRLTTTGRDSQPAWSADGDLDLLHRDPRDPGPLPGRRPADAATTCTTRSSPGSARTAATAR